MCRQVEQARLVAQVQECLRRADDLDLMIVGIHLCAALETLTASAHLQEPRQCKKSLMEERRK